MKLKFNPKSNITAAIAYAKFLDDFCQRHAPIIENRLKEVHAVLKAVADATIDNLLEMCTPEKTKYKVTVEMAEETFAVEATSEYEAEAMAQKMFLDSHHNTEVTVTEMS